MHNPLALACLCECVRMHMCLFMHACVSGPVPDLYMSVCPTAVPGVTVFIVLQMPPS